MVIIYCRPDGCEEKETLDPRIEEIANMPISIASRAKHLMMLHLKRKEEKTRA